MYFADVDLPRALVQAHRDDNLVLFVGAGASFAPPSNLPSFAGVVAKVVAATSETFETADIESRPDYVLGRLEANHIDVHSRVADLITPADSAPNAVHEEIIDLARAARTFRVVTTNWDPHLTRSLSGTVGTEPLAGPRHCLSQMISPGSCTCTAAPPRHRTTW
jgi:NAD-dependent SIR2 family protein deacetylase